MFSIDIIDTTYNVCYMKVSQTLCKKISQVHKALGRMCHTLRASGQVSALGQVARGHR